jgi:hypothetical protein
VKLHQLQNYMLATAMIWETCYEIVANRYLAIRGLYSQFIWEGK